MASVMFGTLMLPSSMYGLLSTRTEAYQPFIYPKSKYDTHRSKWHTYVVVFVPEPWPHLISRGSVISLRLPYVVARSLHMQRDSPAAKRRHRPCLRNCDKLCKGRPSPKKKPEKRSKERRKTRQAQPCHEGVGGGEGTTISDDR